MNIAVIGSGICVETKPAYQDYIARTNGFLPWFPRKTKTFHVD